MLLKIKGIGKINDSSIEMKGITVIAGENNTGKSTFGKVLYCMFNAFHDVDKKIYDARANDIRRIFQGGLPGFIIDFIGQNIINDILSGVDIRKAIGDVVKKYQSFNPKIDINNIIDPLLLNLERSISIEKHEIQQTIVTRSFKQEFSGKVNHINKLDTQGMVSLVIKEKKIDIIIESDDCIFHVDEVGLISDAIYIDTPFIMDDVKNFYGERYTGFYDMIGHRDYLLELLIQRRSNSTVLEEVIFKQKINNLLSNIHSIIGGEFIEDDDNLLFAEQVLKKPVPLSSVSTGIKMFLIIKRLLEQGEINDRDVLILDEPEIHLHPEWQIKFAEILILLQKEFNLTILLTTHSPYFINAIEVFSKKYRAQKNCKFYLAKSDGDVSDVDDVTDNIDEVYQQMALPFQKLDDIAYADDT